MNPIIELAKLTPESPRFRDQVRDAVTDIQERYSDYEAITSTCKLVLSTPHSASSFAWREAVQKLTDALINHEADSFGICGAKK